MQLLRNEMNTTTGNSTLGLNLDSLLAANFINLFLSLPTNAYVLWLIVSGVGGTIESEFFALNLTVSEIVYCVSNILSIIFIYHQAAMIHKAVMFFCAILYVARPLFQTCICLERYLAVVHPVVFLRYKLLRYKLACCSVVWLLVTTSGVVNAVAGLELLNVYIGVFFLVTSLVQLFFCLSVLRVLRQPGPGEGGGREREGGVSSNIKSRAFKIILLILITTLMIYLPFVITIGLYIFGYFSSTQYMYFAISITLCIAIVFGLVQPLLFLHRTGKLLCLNMAP